ncbi:MULTISPECIES: NAD(P)H-binding protein [Shewanella]|uniref:Nucleoside-diphosphate sugar epimerase n=1 Tax=Shewanella algae TaxID=38313 RepID=A0AAD1K6S5_9GAMM|nr:NAD(P)H-binding protein [Shewanella algae]MBO2593791.1 NAD(P)H-binding protein [Shewanella algae]MBO2665251.1 NAD(P)H-binding protein [Shewanella algae]QTE87196.1 NAD(P)H-binding protein [Shewanella algae]BCV43615.1 nucleoside-diphosphate sugar epimerase [Shewanella algae]
MHILLIGANGRSAQAILPRLLEIKEVQLTLFLRRSERLQHLYNDRVRLVEGDANKVDDLVSALPGIDLVINTMGGMDLDRKTRNLVHAMENAQVQRLVALNAGGIYEELPEPFNSWDKSMVGFTRPVNLRSANVIEASSLDYTILRPVWLTDKPIEEFQLTQKGECFLGTETSRASLGRFIAILAKNPNFYSRCNLGISQSGTEGEMPAAYR